MTPISRQHHSGSSFGTRTLLATLFTVTAFSATSMMGCGDDEGDGEITPDPEVEEEARHGLSAEQAAAVLFTIGEEQVTVGEFADRLADQSPYLRARYNSPERRREFLDNLIRFELLAVEAKERGLENLPDVQRARKQVMIQQMMRELFDDEVQLSDITDEQVEEYYNENQQEFRQPEQVRASQVWFRDRAEGERVLAQVRASEDDVNLFRRIAEEHNPAPSEGSEGSDAPQTAAWMSSGRDRMGDLGFFSRPGEHGDANDQGVPNAVRQAAFRIDEIGGVLPELVETAAGFHIIKLTARRAAMTRSLEEARRPIQNRLWRESRERRIAEFLEELREENPVEINEDALSRIQVSIPEHGPTEAGGHGRNHEEPSMAPPTPAPTGMQP